MNVKVSVIVPIYNVEQYIKRCLDSIVNQTLEDIEIICVDDGSEDSSVSIAESYQKKDPRLYIVHQENKGLSAARNHGMRIAKGKYISFIDSDDWVDIDFLEKLYKAAESSGADAACAEIRRPHASGKNPYKLKLKEQKILSSVTDKYRALEIPRKCYVWNKIYLREEIERQNLQFVEGMMFEDIYFTTRYLYNCKDIVLVPGVCYHYWVNSGSITRDLKDKNQMDLLAARADFIKFSREHHIQCDEKFYIKQKLFYKFCGITVLKVYEWETIKKYYLFGLIPFFEKRISL